MERPDWLADPEFATETLRVANRPRLNALLAQAFKTRPVAHWVDGLNAVGVPAGPVYTVPQLVEDEQVKHLGVIQTIPGPQGRPTHYITQPVTLERTPAQVVEQAPGWGEHTEEVLAEHGYTPEEIRRFKAEEVV
jgi:crotonobetainyl-CoA:carnitine CoA-transferase CaiB-like acyl-CoA transferase